MTTGAGPFSDPGRQLRPAYPVRTERLLLRPLRPADTDALLAWESREHGTGEIGYVFHPGHGGHGYATEAARAVLGLGFDGLGLPRITARVDERNQPSARVARRLGMRQEARLVENEWFKGGWTTELGFAMLASEWPRHRDAAERHPRPTAEARG